jgi:hypothetical protein
LGDPRWETSVGGHPVCDRLWWTPSRFLRLETPGVSPRLGTPGENTGGGPLLGDPGRWTLVVGPPELDPQWGNPGVGPPVRDTQWGTPLGAPRLGTAAGENQVGETRWGPTVGDLRSETRGVAHMWRIPRGFICWRQPV